MIRHPFGMMTLLAATMGVRADGTVAPPLAQDRKPHRRQRPTQYASSPAEERRPTVGIPFPNLRHVSRETMNRPNKAKRVLDATGEVGHSVAAFLRRDARRLRRKAHLRLRKRRGWR